mgnify:CR=1 FL=1
MKDKINNVVHGGRSRLFELVRNLRIDQLNPFSRSSASADPYAVHRLEDQMLARDFAVDADAAAISQEPLRARKAIKTVGIAMGVFLVWAMFAEVDEITKGDGKVIPSRQLQVVQSLDGGIVSEIMTKEGDKVKEGQILMRIDATRFMSSFRESRATYLSLLAKAARLRAVADGVDFVPPPEVVAEDPKLVEAERSVYSNRKAELDGQIGIAKEQLSQRTHELGEARARFAKHLQLRMDGTADARKLKSLLLPFVPGTAQVRIRYRNSDAECELVLGENFRVRLDDLLIEALRGWLQPENVEIIY